MISEIELRNYRGFSKHKIPLRAVSIIVGKNNAGKTTIVEALKLISIVVARAPHSHFIAPPEWLETPSAPRGISPSLRGIDFEFLNLCHRYGEPPATVNAKFTDGRSVQIYIHSEHESIFATLRGPTGAPVTTRAHANSFAYEQVNVMPPIGHITIRERVLQEDYVQSNLNTNLASLHFRNQLYHFGKSPAFSGEDDESYSYSDIPTRFDVFTRLAQSSWPHLAILDLERKNSNPPELNLLVRDGSFVAEVGWVGHGLQAWLQTCWFLARCSKGSTIILDEPDVFLHADLQRKLFRLVSGHFAQILIATHSTEVLAEVNPESVLIVDKQEPQAKFAESLPMVQSVMNNIGGAHNIQFTRLWSAKRCIFIEGNDLEFLDAFHRIMFPLSETPLSAIPNIPIGGYGNWKHAVGAAIGFRRAGDKSIQSYCILDSDYRTPEENLKIQDEASRNGLNLHFWQRKEIENYVLVPSALSRLIRSRSKTEGPAPIDVRNQIQAICDELKDNVFDQISNAIGLRDRKGAASANKEARTLVTTAWSSFDGMVSLCPGKQVVSALSAWSQSKFSVSFGALSVAREMDSSDMDSEISALITAIETGKPFSK